MIVKAGGYCMPPFKVQHGMYQGNPIPPMIFDMVLYTTLRHWILVVEEGEEYTVLEGFEWCIQRLVDYLYSDYGIFKYKG